MSGEFGPRPREVAGNEVDELTSNWDSKLSHVYSNEENTDLLRTIIKQAKSRYPEDPDGTKKWLKELQAELENEDDDESVREILQDKIDSESDDYDDEESVYEDEEDEEI